MTEIERYEERPSSEVVRINGDLVTRADLRKADTDSWTSVLPETVELAQGIAPSDMVPDAVRGNVPAVTARFLYGREVGLGPMQSLTQLHNVKGKVGMSAEAMRALVLRAGHEIVIEEASVARVTVAGRRRGSDAWTRVTWTIDDAKAAKLLSNHNYQTYPRQMLTARASAELCRMIFPDVIHGLAAVEEFDDVMVVPGQAPVVDGGEQAAPAPAKKIVSRAKKKASEPAVKPPTPKPSKDVSAAPAESPAREPLPVPEPRGGGARSGEAAAPPPAPEPEIDESLTVEDEPPAEPAITKPQTSMLVAKFNGLDVKDRAERLWITQQLIGREVASAKDLTKREASSVIDTLAPCESREDLENVLKAAEAHRAQSGGDES